MTEQQWPAEARDAAIEAVMDLCWRGQQLTRGHAKLVVDYALRALAEHAAPRPVLGTVDPSALWWDGAWVIDEQTGRTYTSREHAAEVAASALAALAVFDRSTPDA